MKPHDAGTADTVVDKVGVFDATTLGPPSGQQPMSRRASATARTTVLPRIEADGTRVTLVSSSRPRFERRRGLGEGGLGEVVAAHDHDIGREIAIKRLRREVEGPDTIARFVDEIRTVGALEHPNIVPIHDVGEDEDGSLYFVMPCVQGQTLESILEKLAAGDPLAHAYWGFERRMQVFRQLLDAVGFAHKRGFVHRDIKPANVMVGAYGEVFLMDWGIAKPVGAADRPVADPALAQAHSRAGTTRIGSVVGTPAYMSPEQARGEAVDFRSDIYSLCVLLHEWLGLTHYLGHCQTVEEVFDGIQTVKPRNPGFASNPHQPFAPADLGWYAMKGLAKDPADRYQSVDEMLARLDARDEGDFPVQCPITFTKRSTHLFERFVDRHPIVFMAAMAIGAIGSVGAVVRHFL